MKKKAVLLLGGGGFLGSALVKGLHEKRRPVHILSLHAQPLAFSDVSIHEGKIDDVAFLQKLLPDCDTVVHLASATTPGRSAHRPLLEATENIEPTLRLLEVLEAYDMHKIIFVSSGGTLYGNPTTIPVNEDYPLSPISYHGAGKWAIEAFFRVYATRPDRNLIILRPSNLYGPGQALREGFGVVRTMLEHLRSDTVMEIWGEGETVRDFLYIEDMVEACLLLFELRGVSGIYNVGSGLGTSLNQVRELVEKVCGRRLRVLHRPERRGDVRKVILDCSRLRGLLGWQPKVSLEEGIRLTWQWLQTQ
jgi:UDP-glucose 4-epimerase